MKKLDLGAAKNGYKVMTRDGREARIICYDASGDEDNTMIVALVKNPNTGIETPVTCAEDGRVRPFNETEDDLVMAPTEHKRWFNIYTEKGTNAFKTDPTMYETKSAAILNINEAAYGIYVDTNYTVIKVADPDFEI